MKRNELPDLLFNEMKKIFNEYPTSTVGVDKMINQTGFFPGCKGLWLQVPSTVLPSILVLGHDFGNITYYDDLVAGRKIEIKQATFSKLITLFNKAGVDFEKCLFSNAIIGLRETPDMEGEHPDYNEDDFMDKNSEFLKYIIDLLKPKLIITLGKYAAEEVAKLSPIDLDIWCNFQALRVKNIGIQTKIRVHNHICTCVALEHTSKRHLNLHRRVYGYGNDELLGDAAEVKMLKDALAGIF